MSDAHQIYGLRQAFARIRKGFRLAIVRTAKYRGGKIAKQPAPIIAAEPVPDLPQDVSEIGRERVIEATAQAALHSKPFGLLVNEGDRLRDVCQWAEAEHAYAAALAIYPYQAGYWIQHGHMLKEQARFEEAEISYRTACAFGAEPADVLEHLRFVMARLGVSEAQYKIRFRSEGSAAIQVPGQPDVLCLAQLAWQVQAPSAADTLKLLRENATCDRLFAALIEDPRFQRANMDWLKIIRAGEF